ncbi:MAG: substrate-binding domain-containing protein [Rubrivivax sp.]|nr:substrate-binding domain-containing protein [Rubrivivax sp.]
MNAPPARSTTWQRLLAAAALLAAASLAHGAELTLLSGGAIEPGLHAAVQAFKQQTGSAVKLNFNTTPQMRSRVAAGDVFDVVIAPPVAIDEFVKNGKVPIDQRVDVGRVGVGVAVRAGTPLPDISSADAIKRLVLEADALVFNRASTGIYFEALLKRLGVYEQVLAKTTRYADGASVMEHVIKGQGRQIAFGASTEILMLQGKGLQMVGPLPAEIQNQTSYLAVPMAAAGNPEGARAFLRFLATPAAKAIFVAHGID